MPTLIPTKKQWRKWSLPSKLTCIGGYLGFLSLLLAVVFFVWPLEIERRKNQELAPVRETIVRAVGRSYSSLLYAAEFVISPGADTDTLGMYVSPDESYVRRTWFLQHSELDLQQLSKIIDANNSKRQ